MTGALSALLKTSLDYAGLFPPAALDLPAAVLEYESHRAEDSTGMLASFVCPAARLGDFAREARGKVWTLSVLGTNADSPPEALDQLSRDMSRIATFLDANPSFTVSALELRVTPPLLVSPTGLGEFVHSVDRTLAGSPRAPRKVFYEMGWNTRWPDALPMLAGGNSFRGAKIRTGGLEASAFPSVEDIAGFMVAARDAGVPWKATAGLHHPLRRFQAEVGAKMHGFLNVFLGAALAYQGHDEAAVVELLNEEDAGTFRFSDESVRWRDHALDRGLLSRTRAEFALSFGSCSYREPVGDLKALRLL